MLFEYRLLKVDVFVFCRPEQDFYNWVDITPEFFESITGKFLIYLSSCYSQSSTLFNSASGVVYMAKSYLILVINV